MTQRESVLNLKLYKKQAALLWSRLNEQNLLFPIPKFPTLDMGLMN